MKIATFYYCLLLFIITSPVLSQTREGDLNPGGYLISTQTMHVHFDKDIYLYGETIWFKAYLYNMNEISVSSTNFYVALYDEKGELIQQKQYPILAGSCYGDFQLPDSLHSSRLQFRAFTKAMILNDSNNVYKKNLTVYDKENNEKAVPVNKKIILRFFPEGGQLITELQNHIAFKASYSDGSPANISGQIIEVEMNKVTDSFFTNTMGLGKFILTPAPKKNYIAVWKDENGNTKQIPLPDVNRYGVSFHTEIINKELHYTIAKNKSSDSLSLLHLQAQMGNYNVYKADLVIPNEMELSMAKFSIDSLPVGLLQLTLFDKYWNPLQERLIFINDSALQNQPEVNRDTINRNGKGKNSIEIILHDTLYSDLSASIADINFYNQPNTRSISQDFWFSAQQNLFNLNLDSFLYNYNKQAVDLVMLAHNWKKYNWQKASGKKEGKPELSDNYISLSVKYHEKDLALPANDALNLIINNTGIDKQFYNLQPNDQTTFKKTGLIFFDSVKISYQMNKNKDLVKYLTISKEDTEKIPSAISALPDKINSLNTMTGAAANDIDSFFTTGHIKFNDVQTIKRVVVKSKYKGNPQLARIDELDKFYTSGMFSGNKGYQLNIIDDTLGVNANSNLQDYIRYRVPGLSLYQGIFGVRRTVIEAISNGNSANKVVDTILPVLTFIDEVLTEGDAVSLLNMWNVAYVKYIPGIVIGGSFRTSTGALYIYTKKGTEKGPPAKGLPFVYVVGYNRQKEFISPDYRDRALLNESDLRSTLYWNPNIILDKTNNKIKIEYYNNDVSKKLLLTIEGVNAAGKLIHIEKIIE